MSKAARVWSIGAGATAPFLRVMLRRRAAAGKEHLARLAERYGIETAPRPDGRVLWLHAASVGEALSVLPVLEALPADIFTLFTTGTVTSERLLRQRLPGTCLEGRVAHRFVPLDVPVWVARFLDHWRPDLAAFVESEIWPNILAACRARDIPTVLLNARMSVRSAARWCHVPAFAAELIGGFAWIAAQSEADARRLVSLGGGHVEALGNLKFAAANLPVDEDELARLADLVGDRPRWLAASTHPGDEEAVAEVHRGLAGAHPGLLTAIVPRHPERGAAIAAILGGAPRRALGQDPGDGIWIADTLGEVGLLYRLFPSYSWERVLRAAEGRTRWNRPALAARSRRVPPPPTLSMRWRPCVRPAGWRRSPIQPNWRSGWMPCWAIRRRARRWGRQRVRWRAARRPGCRRWSRRGWRR